MLPLFKMYPSLAQRLPWIPLCMLPTPVDPMADLAAELGIRNLYIKRDDLSGELHGGNKVRKLEFILAEAKRTGRGEVLTFGYAGSNHAAATAFYACQLGMRSISMLLPQPNSPVVRQNLLLSHACGAELHLQPNKVRLALSTIGQLVRHTLRYGHLPMVIPAGGSSPLGAIGFVNAAFELRDQITGEALQEPDWLYVALGSMGTAAGLLLGLRAAGLKTKIAAIQVTDSSTADKKRTLELAEKTRALLRRYAPEFPESSVHPDDLDVRTEFFGPGYGAYTPEGQEAAELMQTHLGIPLDGTYSAKAFGAIVHDARQGIFADKSVLFWDTFNSRPEPYGESPPQSNDIPQAFQTYFRET